MKQISLLLAILLGAFMTYHLISSRKQAADHAARLAQQQAQYDAERARLEAALEAAQRRSPLPLAPVAAPPSVPSSTPAPSRLSPEEIIQRLKALARTGGASPIARREIVYWLEDLIRIGSPAVPAISAFLDRYEDIDLDTSPFQSRGARDRVPIEFTVPPSLRLGLFDVLRRIGTASALEVLARSLENTVRGVEVAYLARVLEQLAPGAYREQALSVARALLREATPAATDGVLDRYHRDYLYGVLSEFGDLTFTEEAQAQLVHADSQIDRGALKYLQQTLGARAVPIVAQAYSNPALTNSHGKEPLVRMALNFVGADPVADQFYAQAINDPILNRSHRKNLIEDLNQNGFADTRDLTANDLPLIESRIRLIERLAPDAMDEINTLALAEAYKDLINMRAKINEQ